MRKSGILLHISCLPSNYGIGTLGSEAYKFVDFLEKCQIKCWQILPLGPTSFGDSPYQSLGTFANNPYFIDLDELVLMKLLKEEDLKHLKNSKNINYNYLYKTRFLVLKKAFEHFDLNDYHFNEFCQKESYWLDDYSLFMTLKKYHNDNSFIKWEECYKYKDIKALDEFKNNNPDEINFYKFIQYIFSSQWKRLKEYANNKDISIIGDMPIYVALDSCDVWSNPENFLLDYNYEPSVVAGVPPDYFSKTGQLWGNPIYNYEKMEKDNYSWWITRINRAFEMFDYVRIDHFRGFASYYVISSNEKTAINGKWEKGPGMNLFSKVTKFKNRIIAEDLGILTDDVFELLEEVGYPGMKVLQFAFDNKNDNLHLPHNYQENSICYTGTHDNMTLKEWILSLNLEELTNLKNYLGGNLKTTNSFIDRLIMFAYLSVSKICIIPLVDWLQLGSSARLNNPATGVDNWKYRIKKDLYSEKLIQKISLYNKLYRR